jgi:cell division protein FtsB
VKRVLNLIPLATRRRMVAMRVYRQWANAVATAGVACTVLLAIEWGRGLAAVEQLRSLDTQHAPLTKLQQEKTQLETRIAQLRAREELSLSLSHATPGLATVGAVSKAAEEVEGGVYITRFEFANAATSATEREQESAATLKLVGAGLDGLVIAAFVEYLRETGAFSSVSIAATRPLAGGAPALRAFEIDCIL